MRAACLPDAFTRNQILKIEGIERTSTAISILELMPPRYDGLTSRLSEQESSTAHK